MKTRSRARMTMAMIVAAIILAGCQQHTESAGSRASDHRGPYGGVEGGGGF